MERYCPADRVASYAGIIRKTGRGPLYTKHGSMCDALKMQAQHPIASKMVVSVTPVKFFHYTPFKHYTCM